MDRSSPRKILLVSLLLFLAVIPSPLFDAHIVLILCVLALVFLATLPNIIKNPDLSDVFLLIFVAVVSFELSYSRDTVIALERYIRTYLPLLIIYFISRNQREDFYLTMTRSFVFTGFIVSLFMIFEFFTGRNPIFENFFQNQYIKNEFFYKNRAFGVFYHPTIAGFFLAVCLPLHRLLLSDGSRRTGLIAGSVSFIVTSLALIMTFSKMAYVIMFFVYLWYLKQRNPLISRILMSVVLLSAAFLISRFDVFKYQFRPVLLITAIDSRWKSLITAVDMIKEHPFAGVGLDHFRLLFLDYAWHGDMFYCIKIPDNMYLTILTENGVLGFAAFMGFLLVLVKKAVYGLRGQGDQAQKKLIKVLLASFSVILVHSVSYDLFYWSTSLVVFAMLAGAIANISGPKPGGMTVL